MSRISSATVLGIACPSEIGDACEITDRSGRVVAAIR